MHSIIRLKPQVSLLQRCLWHNSFADKDIRDVSAKFTSNKDKMFLWSLFLCFEVTQMKLECTFLWQQKTREVGCCLHTMSCEDNLVRTVSWVKPREQSLVSKEPFLFWKWYNMGSWIRRCNPFVWLTWEDVSEWHVSCDSMSSWDASVYPSCDSMSSWDASVYPYKFFSWDISWGCCLFQLLFTSSLWEFSMPLSWRQFILVHLLSRWTTHSHSGWTAVLYCSTLGWESLLKNSLALWLNSLIFTIEEYVLGFVKERIFLLFLIPFLSPAGISFTLPFILSSFPTLVVLTIPCNLLPLDTHCITCPVFFDTLSDKNILQTLLLYLSLRLHFIWWLSRWYFLCYCFTARKDCQSFLFFIDASSSTFQSSLCSCCNLIPLALPSFLVCRLRSRWSCFRSNLVLRADSNSLPVCVSVPFVSRCVWTCVVFDAAAVVALDVSGYYVPVDHHWSSNSQ